MKKLWALIFLCSCTIHSVTGAVEVKQCPEKLLERVTNALEQVNGQEKVKP